MAVKCKNCGGAHPSWDCSKPTKSTSARKDVRANKVISRPERECPNTEASPKGCDMARHASSSLKTLKAGTQALPVDTLPKPKMGRPRTGYIKAEYNRQYSADQRTIKRLGLNCTVSEFRKLKEE